MPKLAIGSKAERVLELLRGLRVAAAERGFAASSSTAGWQRLRALTAGRMLTRAAVRQGHTLLAQLGAWEERWLPIASAALRERHQDVYEWLFRNRAHTEGASVVISVGTFLARLEAMAGEPELGARGAEARALLRQRGLCTSTLQGARDLLVALGATAPAQGLAPAAAAPCLRHDPGALRP